MKTKLLELYHQMISSHLYETKELEGRFRKHSGLPYPVHCNAVMARVAHYGINFENAILLQGGEEYVFDVLAASMGHDLAEDTKAHFERWSARSFEIISECTRSDEQTSSRQGKWDFLMTFLTKSVEAVIIKIADRYCNVMDYMDTDPKYAAKYALQAFPLYYRFLRNIKTFPRLVIVNLMRDVSKLQEIINSRWSRISFENDFEQVRKLVV